MLSSDSPFSIRSRIIPFELFKLLCSVTETFRLKKEETFKRFSVCVFLLVSTSRVLFFSFFSQISEYQLTIQFASKRSLDLSHPDFDDEKSRKSVVPTEDKVR